MQVTKHLAELNKRIAAAAAGAGRSETEVSVLAVTKRHPVEAVQAAVAAGLSDMGENYLQEALEKISAVTETVNWHFIGRVQSNKTRQIAENFDWVHTVASARVARRLSEQRPPDLPPLNICVQVCTDAQGEHAGVQPGDAAELCALIADLANLKLRGLMTIPLPADTEDEQRKPFRVLRELRDDLNDAGLNMDTLSMGMSGDLEAAIAEGSTMVRIGTALFGPRPG